MNTGLKDEMMMSIIMMMVIMVMWKVGGMKARMIHKLHHNNYTHDIPEALEENVEMALHISSQNVMT